jgi:hypothetical protein
MGGFYMVTKDQFEDSNLHLKRLLNEEVLEISSTGYGLESISKDKADNQKGQEQENVNSIPNVDNKSM